MHYCTNSIAVSACTFSHATPYSPPHHPNYRAKLGNATSLQNLQKFAKLAKVCKTCKTQLLTKGNCVISSNPFTPTFGLIPPFMAGREELVEDLSAAFAHGLGDPNLCTVISGARGTGKTALLSFMADEAASQGWISVNTTASEGMLEDILLQTGREAASFLEAIDSRKLRGINIGQLIGLEWDNESDRPANWRLHMTEALEQLAEHEIGLLITVDEVSANFSEMKQLARIYQHFIREGRKVGLLMAGLPFAVSGLLSDEDVSFLRRARKHTLGRISDADIRDAMKLAIVEAGRDIERSALDMAVEAIDGFPYMMQLVGYRIWAENPQTPIIDEQDVRHGIKLAQAEMIEGILDYTYRDLSKGDRRFLTAMASHDAPVSLAEISTAMGVKSNYASQYRRRLLEQGVIGETPAGKLRFDIPAFRDYLLEQVQEDELDS